jgi:hypothetical protein
MIMPVIKCIVKRRYSAPFLLIYLIGSNIIVRKGALERAFMK